MNKTNSFKLIVIFLVFTSILLLGLAYFFGDWNNADQKIEEKTLTTDIINRETDDLMGQKVFLQKSSVVNVRLELREESAGKIEVWIGVNKPKILMKNVIVSAIISEEFFSNLNASDPLISNALVSNSFGDKEWSDLYTIAPEKKSPEGIETSRVFIIAPTSSYNKLVKLTDKVKVKLTWQDEKNQVKSEYLELEGTA
ncbi:MAG: hypothetical protein ACRCWQ_00315 [Bacilli bacterium]